MEQNKYVKLSEIDGKTFTVQKAGGYVWKKWNEAERKMEVSRDYKEGFRKIYAIETDLGNLDASQAQLKNMLEATYFNGKADISGVTFKVKKVMQKNGFPEYYFNAQKQEKPSGIDQARAQADSLRPQPPVTNEYPEDYAGF